MKLLLFESSSTRLFKCWKNTPGECEQILFSTTNFHRFHVHLFKLFFPQLNDQTYSDSEINLLLFHFLNQNHSLVKFLDQINHDAEKLMKHVLNVVTQTDFELLPRIWTFPESKCLRLSWYFGKLEKFINKFTSYYSSLRFDADDEYSAKIEMLQVSYASSEYSCSATVPHKYPPTILPILIHFQIYLVIPYHNCNFPQKNNSTKKSFTQYFINNSRKNKMTQGKNLSTFIPHRTLKYWILMNPNSVTS